MKIRILESNGWYRLQKKSLFGWEDIREDGSTYWSWFGRFHHTFKKLEVARVYRDTIIKQHNQKHQKDNWKIVE